ncbi:hypothetical protein, partial [Streptomyces sp. URMC 125]|uniref:hypothetical protein n=1 Tax=Streptomyces sp. URMC 125 TaxID=3423419 RepID=UPI003F1B138B
PPVRPPHDAPAPRGSLPIDTTPLFSAPEPAPPVTTTGARPLTRDLFRAPDFGDEPFEDFPEDPADDLPEPAAPAAAAPGGRERSARSAPHHRRGPSGGSRTRGDRARTGRRPRP